MLLHWKSFGHLRNRITRFSNLFYPHQLALSGTLMLFRIQIRIRKDFFRKPVITQVNLWTFQEKITPKGSLIKHYCIHY
jgi:hypothetical protein